MNKKIVILILAIFCIIATIVMSVFGKIPEDTTRNAVESIEFVDPTKADGKCELNEDGEKIIYIERGTTEYQINYIINPTDASELDVYFEIINGKQYASINETGFIVFEKEYTITVKIWSNYYDNKTDTVIIEFGGEITSVIPPTVDPFA